MTHSSRNTNLKVVISIIVSVFVMVGGLLWRLATNPSTWIIVGIALVACAIIIPSAKYINKRRRTFLYASNSDTQEKIDALDDLFLDLSNHTNLRYIPSDMIGFSSSAWGKDVKLERNIPPGIYINIDIWHLCFEEVDIYFLPDKVIIIDKDGIGDFIYSELEISFVDKKTTGNTWLHTTKSGFRDERYKYNPEIPIVSSEAIEFEIKTGRVIYLEVSDRQAALTFVQKWQLYCQPLGVLTSISV